MFLSEEETVGSLKHKILWELVGEEVEEGTQVCLTLRSSAYDDVLENDETLLRMLPIEPDCTVALTTHPIINTPVKFEGCKAGSIALSRCSKRCAIGDRTGNVSFWNTQTGEKLWESNAGDRDAVSVGVSACGKWVISVGRAMFVWCTRDGKRKKTLKGHSKWTGGVACSPGYPVAVTCSDDTNLRLWNLETGKCVRKLQGHTDAVEAVAMSTDMIVSGSQDRTVRVWKVRDGSTVHLLGGHNADVIGVAVTEGGVHVVSSSLDRNMRVWCTRTGQCLHNRLFFPEKGVMTAVGITDKHIFTRSTRRGDSQIRVWDLDEAELQVVHTETSRCDVFAVALTRDSKYGFYACKDHLLVLETGLTDDLARSNVTNEI